LRDDIEGEKVEDQEKMEEGVREGGEGDLSKGCEIDPADH